ncbi:MAG: methylaspartate mutase subunit S, partial [Oscillospiraceae bacterium]
KQIDFPVAEATIISRNGLKMKFSNHFLRGVPSMQTEQTRKKVLVIGVIGADVHAVGNKILYHAFTEAGFDVVNLGVMVSQEEYISAAIESDADAIVVSSLYGQGELDCRGMREKCDEAGLLGIPLVVGGSLSTNRNLRMWKALPRLGLTAPSPERRPKRPSTRCVSFCIWMPLHAARLCRYEACLIDGFRQHLYQADGRRR